MLYFLQWDLYNMIQIWQFHEIWFRSQSIAMKPHPNTLKEENISSSEYTPWNMFDKYFIDHGIQWSSTDAPITTYRDQNGGGGGGGGGSRFSWDIASKTTLVDITSGNMAVWVHDLDNLLR